MLEALAAVERVTGVESTALTGVCAGGIIASLAAAHLAATGGQDRLAAFTLLVTVLDNAQAGTSAALVDESLAEAAKALSRRRGYLDGRALAEVFAWLRPGDLIWNYWVNNYLLGKQPPAFDILFWNADTTRMTAGLHADFIDISLGNGLVTPGAVTVLGIPVDLSRVGVDAYVVAGIADHITPWQNCYRSAQLLGGDTRFVLSTSGHIAALVNPPGQPQGDLPDQQGHHGRRAAVAAVGAPAAGQLVAGLRGLAGRAQRCAERCTHRARRRWAASPRRGTRHLRLRELRKRQ